MELEHKAYWVIKESNYELTTEGQKRYLIVQELEELHLHAYENAKIYKELTKAWHNKRISPTEIKVGDQVLLYNARLRLFLGKLKSR